MFAALYSGEYPVPEAIRARMKSAAELMQRVKLACSNGRAGLDCITKRGVSK